MNKAYGLTVAEKHELIIQFNNERDGANEVYQSAKEERKKEETMKGTAKQPKEYGKLYKHLGTDNRNKDVR